MSHTILFSPRVQSYLHAVYLFDQHAMKGPVRSQIAFKEVNRLLREATNGTWKNLRPEEQDYCRDRFNDDIVKVRLPQPDRKTKKSVYLTSAMRIDLEEQETCSP